MLVAELKEIFKRLNNLPTLPSIARSLLQMTVEENAQVDDVVRLVEADPASTARLLRIVNSAYRGLNGKVTSINRAVVLLGFNGIRNALLSVQIFNIFGKDAAASFRQCLHNTFTWVARAIGKDFGYETQGNWRPELDQAIPQMVDWWKANRERCDLMDPTVVYPPPGASPRR